MDTPKTTSLGSPCSPNWNADWIAYVDEIEAELGQRICGARTRCGDLCCMEPTHPNGRCRFHGGIEAYGGKEGNTHALRTGLYSFRLRPCSVKCPMWTKCPFAGEDVMQLHEADRPACAYEQQEYDDAIAEVTAMAAGEENDGPETIAARESLTRAAGPYAMARVMTMRASMALADESLVNVKHVNGELPHSRVSGHAEVYLRLDRAHRTREQHISQTVATIARTRRQQAERQAKTDANGEVGLAAASQKSTEDSKPLEKETSNGKSHAHGPDPVTPAPVQQSEQQPPSPLSDPPRTDNDNASEPSDNHEHPAQRPSSPSRPSEKPGPSQVELDTIPRPSGSGPPHFSDPPANTARYSQPPPPAPEKPPAPRPLHVPEPASRSG